MNKIKSLKYRKCVATFMATIITTLSVSYTQNIQTDAVLSTPEIVHYWRHDYNDSDYTTYDKYSLIVDGRSNAKTSKTVSNDMVRDTDTAVVRLDDGKDPCGGSGFIVGDHEIATVAHCVYNRTINKFLDFKISVIDENNKVIETISPHYVHINEDYETARGDASPYDYAMIYVDEDLSPYGKFNIGIALDSYADKNGSVIVSGFPQKYPDGYDNKNWGIRFKAKGNIIGKTVDAFQYDADVASGDSGGPVYIEEGIVVNGELYEYKTVIAIHKASGNWGAKITPKLAKLYGDNPHKTK
ncbi:MAG: trypsin-like peptidase domain-containing protein [Ruminococcus sp.]|nr:trypsin-like peptidase domain-containing protein [Ruminococcus sp.]